MQEWPRWMRGLASAAPPRAPASPHKVGDVLVASTAHEREAAHHKLGEMDARARVGSRLSGGSLDPF